MQTPTVLSVSQATSETPAIKVITSGGKSTNVTKGFDIAQKEAARLSVTPRSQSPASGRATPVGAQVSAEQTADDNRKQRENAVTQYKKERGGFKEHLYMVVIGHVDAGKSTLMGHLLCELGQVRQLFYFFSLRSFIVMRIYFRAIDIRLKCRFYE